MTSSLDPAFAAHGLLATDWAYIRAVLAQEPTIERAWLYGSRARATHRLGSDVDLALEGPLVDLEVVARVAHRLQDEGPLPYLFDLVVVAELPADHPLRGEITRESLLVWVRP